MKFQRFLFTLCAALSLLIAQSAQAAPTTIQFFDGTTGLTAANATVTPTSPTYTDTTDYSASGASIGRAGFVFFNWDAPSPTGGFGASIVNQNVNDQLPSWLELDYDPNSADFSFGNDTGLETFAKGGINTWDTLTLPDGTSGLSGALVDPASDGNTNNTISALYVRPGGPTTFWVHIVVDNTNGEHDPASRLRAREDADGASSRLNSIPDLDGATAGHGADVYSFLYTNVQGNDFLKIQLNSGVGGEDASIAGFMIDVIPEPTSAALLVLGSLGCLFSRRRLR